MGKTEIEALGGPLTSFTEEEQLFQSTVRQFASDRISPLVKEIDEAGVFQQDLIIQQWVRSIVYYTISAGLITPMPPTRKH